MTNKTYTYRTQAEVDAALTVLGAPTKYTVVIAGVVTPQAVNYTLKGAVAEVETHRRVHGASGMVLDAITGLIVYAA